jgi:hypothetical protein
MERIVIAPPPLPLTVHVTPSGRILLIPGPSTVWPPDLDADQADTLAAQLTDAATHSRGILEA